MRRLLRWTFNALAAVSLLLCVTVCLLWARSYWTTDAVRYWQPPAVVVAISERGHLEAGIDRGKDNQHPAGLEWAAYPSDYIQTTWDGDVDEASAKFVVWGFGYVNDDGPDSPYSRAVGMPHWGAALFALLLPAVAARRLWVRGRAARSIRMAQCPACGYDLRATPDGSKVLDRCPECGRKRANEAQNLFASPP